MGVDGQRHASVALPPGKRPVNPCIGGWLGPRAGPDGCGNFRSHQDSIPGPSSSVASCYTDRATAANELLEFTSIKLL